MSNQLSLYSIGQLAVILSVIKMAYSSMCFMGYTMLH